MLCKIGEVEVWRILDWHGLFLTPEALFPNAPEDVAQIIEDLAPGSVDAASGRLILPVQGFLLKTPSQVILIDACLGNHKTAGFDDWAGRDDGRFLAGLTAAGVTPAEIDVVFCTHLHVDHVGWNTRLENGQWVPTFPNARYLLPEADVEHYGKDAGETYTESVLPVIAAGQAELVRGSHEVADGITLFPTPGHTPGHSSVMIDSGGARAVITGDAIHSTAQCAHPHWQFKFDTDGEAAVDSRRQLLEMAAERGPAVIGSHFTLPSLGRIEGTGGVFTWTPCGCG
jgi:glyoxylase-like metal-dependent hydrolase (beta-lactamase superfamily II)